MAPLATNNSSNGSSSNGAGSGMPHSVITGIIIALLLGGTALAAFLIFGFKTYRKWWKNSRNASPSSPAPAVPALPAHWQRSRGGGTPATAALPRFAQNISAALHLPSSYTGRSMSSVRGSPTGMGSSHTRRGSETSTNSNAELLPMRVSPPPSPKPAFLGRGAATGQGSTH